MSLSLREYTCGGTIRSTLFEKTSFFWKLHFIVFADKVTVTKLHLSLIRLFNLDELINRQIKLVKRRILKTPVANDIWKFTGVESSLYTKWTNEFRIKSSFEMRLLLPKCVDEVCVDPTLPLAHRVEMVTCLKHWIWSKPPIGWFICHLNELDLLPGSCFKLIGWRWWHDLSFA
jgi:hypothetical protein